MDSCSYEITAGQEESGRHDDAALHPHEEVSDIDIGESAGLGECQGEAGHRLAAAAPSNDTSNPDAPILRKLGEVLTGQRRLSVVPARRPGDPREIAVTIGNAEADGGRREDVAELRDTCAERLHPASLPLRRRGDRIRQACGDKIRQAC